jgi:tetratricopeptide (TPR) repeat protein
VVHPAGPASVDCGTPGLALGQQARERQLMRCRESCRCSVIADAPRLDNAGGHRVLALLLLRAPGWPTGPGDPEAGLEHARKADELAPDHPENLLALGEALAATGNPDAARLAYQRAGALAKVRAAGGDPDAAGWAESAARALLALR